MNDELMMAELIRLRDGGSKSALVQSRAKDAIADLRRARTLRKKAKNIFLWCAYNASK